MKVIGDRWQVRKGHGRRVFCKKISEEVTANPGVNFMKGKSYKKMLIKKHFAQGLTSTITPREKGTY